MIRYNHKPAKGETAYSVDVEIDTIGLRDSLIEQFKNMDGVRFVPAIGKTVKAFGWQNPERVFTNSEWLNSTGVGYILTNTNYIELDWDCDLPTAKANCHLVGIAPEDFDKVRDTAFIIKGKNERWILQLDPEHCSELLGYTTINFGVNEETGKRIQVELRGGGSPDECVRQSVAQGSFYPTPEGDKRYTSDTIFENVGILPQDTYQIWIDSLTKSKKTKEITHSSKMSEYTPTGMETSQLYWDCIKIINRCSEVRDQYEDYNDWIKVAKICNMVRDAQEGLNMFLLWSRAGVNFNCDDDAEETFRNNYDKDNRDSSSKITVGTLVNMAKLSIERMTSTEIYSMLIIDKITEKVLLDAISKRFIIIASSGEIYLIDSDYKGNLVSLQIRDKMWEIYAKSINNNRKSDSKRRGVEHIPYTMYPKPYAGISSYNPEDVRVGVYNLFKPYELGELSGKGGMDLLFQDMIQTVVKGGLCNNSEDDFEFFMLFLSSIVKDPWDKSNNRRKNVVFGTAEQGVGKGLFCGRILGEMLGNYHAKSANGKDFLQTSNINICNKTLVFADEMPTFNMATVNALRTFTGDDEISYRKLYADGITVENRARIIITTNGDIKNLIGSDTDRFRQIQTKFFADAEEHKAYQVLCRRIAANARDMAILLHRHLSEMDHHKLDSLGTKNEQTNLHKAEGSIVAFIDSLFSNYSNYDPSSKNYSTNSYYGIDLTGNSIEITGTSLFNAYSTACADLKNKYWGYRIVKMKQFTVGLQEMWDKTKTNKNTLFRISIDDAKGYVEDTQGGDSKISEAIVMGTTDAIRKATGWSK